MIDWNFDAWPAIEPRWDNAAAEKPDDTIPFHVDLGCGKLKKGRIGIDRFPAEGVNIVMDLNTLVVDAVPHETGGLADVPPQPIDANTPAIPLPTSSIDSMISHHCLEHIGDGFMHLMDECWRVLKPDAAFRIIVPLFPSTTAVEDPDHKRYFMEHTLDSFCGDAENCWLSSFSVPYTKARFRRTNLDMTALNPPEKRWTDEDRRELRCTLRAVK